MDVTQQVKQLISVKDVVNVEDPAACVVAGVVVLKSQWLARRRFSMGMIRSGLFTWGIFRVVSALRSQPEHGELCVVRLR